MCSRARALPETASNQALLLRRALAECFERCDRRADAAQILGEVHAAWAERGLADSPEAISAATLFAAVLRNLMRPEEAEAVASMRGAR
jgi:hypothetical protein